MQCCGFDPPLGRIFSSKGDFSLELTWVLTPFPQNPFGWEYKPRSSLCTHAFHRTQEIMMFMPYKGECWQQKHTHHALSTKTECDYLNGWIKKMITNAKNSPKMVNTRDLVGERRRRRRIVRLECSVICGTKVPAYNLFSHADLCKKSKCLNCSFPAYNYMTSLKFPSLGNRPCKKFSLFVHLWWWMLVNLILSSTTE